jgi:hypothetical protein
MLRMILIYSLYYKVIDVTENLTSQYINTLCSFEQRELEHKYIYIYRA